MIDNQPTALSVKRRRLASLTLTALFGALTAAGTFIAIPLPFTPVPVVLQNFFAIIAGLALGPLLGGAAVGLYLIAGALGAPVFAGAVGGFVHFFAPSGGYLFGYLLAAFTAGLIAGKPKAGQRVPRWRIILAGVVGFLTVYIPGLWGLKIALDCSWPTAFASGFAPFLIGDAIKAAAVAFIVPRLRDLTAEFLAP